MLNSLIYSNRATPYRAQSGLVLRPTPVIPGAKKTPLVRGSRTGTFGCRTFSTNKSGSRRSRCFVYQTTLIKCFRNQEFYQHLIPFFQSLYLEFHLHYQEEHHNQAVHPTISRYPAKWTNNHIVIISITE